MKPVAFFCFAVIASTSILQSAAQQKIDLATLNKIRFADQFPGADIGDKINAAIADCPSGPAAPVGCNVRIAAGNYSYSTTIKVNKCDIYLQGAGFRATSLNYIGSGDGLDVVSAPGPSQCVSGITRARTGTILEGFGLFTSTAATSAIQLGDNAGGANFAHIRDVWISTNGSGSWQNGLKFINSQNVLIDGSTTIYANSGNGVKNLITMDGDSRGDTFVGVNLTGKANEGTVNGVQTTGKGGEFFWYGGVVQGGFTGAAFNCNNCTGGIFGAHLELTSGGGDGIIYDNSTFGFTVDGTTSSVAGPGDGVKVGSTAPAWDFSLHGGSYTSINVSAKAHNAQIYPNMSNKAVVNNGANTTIGQYRVVGKTVPQFYMFQSTTFSTLGAAPDGSVVYCSDCKIATACSAGGSGALAKHIAGAWVCN